MENKFDHIKEEEVRKEYSAGKLSPEEKRILRNQIKITNDVKKRT